MGILPPATYRRLQKLPQDQSVWEGDRQAVDPQANFAGDWFDLNPDRNGSTEEQDCILWADGSQGMVRAMDLVPIDSGAEATVRTLLRAMEHPHSPGLPTRPQKIVVRDRELQFFLRGILRDLGIAVECVPSLPFLDEVFQTLTQERKTTTLSLPPEWLTALQSQAKFMWDCAPWTVLADHQILAIELNQWDLDTLYVSTMGKAEMEYGLLFYRSLDSLKRFREAAASSENPDGLEEIFLIQDCLYLTYDQEDAEDRDSFFPFRITPEWEDLDPTFGSIHPLEGMRPFLYEEEAQVLLAGLDAIAQFVKQHRRKFKGGKFPSLQGTYKIDSLPGLAPFEVSVMTLPDIAQELLTLDDEAADAAAKNDTPVLHDDLVPEGAMYWLGHFSWEFYESLTSLVKIYQPTEKPFKRGKEGISILCIQTSRPKAKSVLTTLLEAGGVESIAFGSGEGFWGERFDLGIVKTHNQLLHLFADYPADDPTHRATYKKWIERCRKNQQHCALVVAEGVTGGSRGNPEAKHIVAIYEASLVSASDLGLSTLQLMPKFDFPI